MSGVLNDDKLIFSTSSYRQALTPVGRREGSREKKRRMRRRGERKGGQGKGREEAIFWPSLRQCIPQCSRIFFSSCAVLVCIWFLNINISACKNCVKNAWMSALILTWTRDVVVNVAMTSLQVNEFSECQCTPCNVSQLLIESIPTESSRLQRTADRHSTLPPPSPVRHRRGRNGELCGRCRPGGSRRKAVYDCRQELFAFNRRKTCLPSFLLDLICTIHSQNANVTR